MIKDLIFTCKVVGLIALILVGIVFIFAVIKGVIDTIINSRAKRKFADEITKAFLEQLEKQDKEEEPKKKTAKKKTTKKDSN